MSKQKGGKTPTPNDQRSVVKDPNTTAHKEAQDNRGNQLDPNHEPTKPPAKTGGGGSADGKKA